MATERAERNWAVVRMVLGQIQIVGALVSLILLFQIGVGEATVVAVMATCVATTVSVLLFGARNPRVKGE